MIKYLIAGIFGFGVAKLLSKKPKSKTTEKYKKGGRTISQTPAPKKDQIKGSDKNKEGSSKDTESAKQINFNEKTLNSIQNKVTEHNKQYPNKKITLASAKAVVRRGMGAYSNTYRPTISGGKPNSRVAWGLARLNAFTYKIINGKSKSGKYSQDDDLINELGYKVAKYEIGGVFHGSSYYFDKFNTDKIGSGIGQQQDGWGIYLTDDKESSKNYGNYIYETTLFKDKNVDEYTFLDLKKPVKKDLVSKIVEALYKNFNKEFDINKFNLYYNYTKNKSLPKVDFNDYELIEFDYSGYLFYKTLSRILGGDKKASLFLLNNEIDGSISSFENSEGVIYRTDYVIFDENAITIENKAHLPNNYYADGGDIQAYEEAMGISYAEGGEAKPKKVYVSIKLPNELEYVNNEKGDWYGDRFSKYDDQPFEELKNNQLIGIRGVSLSPNNVGDWFSYKDCLVVMNYDEFFKLNDATKVKYDDPYQLMANDLKIFNRLYGNSEYIDEREKKITRRENLKKIIEKLPFYFDKAKYEYYYDDAQKRDELQRYYYILGNYSNNFIPWIIDNEYIINSPNDLTERLIEFAHLPNSESGIDNYRNFNLEKYVLTAEDLLPIVMKGLVKAGSTYTDEAEVIINNKLLNLPNNTQLFFKKEDFKDSDLQDLIDKYELEKTYRVYSIKSQYIKEYQDKLYAKRTKRDVSKWELGKEQLEIKKELILNDLQKLFFNKSLDKINKILDEKYPSTYYFDWEGEETKYFRWNEVIEVQFLLNKFFEITLRDWKSVFRTKRANEIYSMSFYGIYNSIEHFLREFIEQNRDYLENINKYHNENGDYLWLYDIERAVLGVVGTTWDEGNGISDKQLAKKYFQMIGGELTTYYKQDEIVMPSIYKNGGGVLLAPNGKPSKLTPEQYKLVRSESFKAWFGDWENDPENASKVVDENGEPLVVYSGSPRQFTIFESDEILVDKDDKEFKPRFWFTIDKQYADSMASKTFGTPTIYICFLNIRNPKYDNFNLYLDEFYDGSIQYNRKNINVVTAINSNQIKLADGTNTTFDSNNNDIRYNKGGLIAPNGKPSKLTPEQYKLVRTPAFKEFFGDWENSPETASKVVDSNGEPKVVGRMDYERKYKYADEHPIFFCEKEDVKYFTEFGENEIYVFLNIKNPIIIQFGQSWDNIPYDELMKVFSTKDLINMINYEWNDNYKSWDEYLNSIDDFEPFLFSTDIISNYVKNKGINDGIIIYDIDETSNHEVNTNDYIVFNSNQIKLGDGTNTTFDSNNADIRYKTGGEIKDLVVLHNINDYQIEEANKIGGLITPSIAILKAGQSFTDFGSITLIGTKELIDPENRSVKVFAGDVYSPSVPRKLYYVDKRLLEKITNELIKKAYQYDDTISKSDREIYHLVSYAIGSHTSFEEDINKMSFNELLNYYYDKLKIVYIVDKSIKIKVPMKAKRNFLWNNVEFTLNDEQIKRFAPILREYTKQSNENGSNGVSKEIKSQVYDLFLEVLKNIKQKIKQEFYDKGEQGDILYKIIIDDLVKSFEKYVGTRYDWSGYTEHNLSKAVWSEKELDKEKLNQNIKKIFTKDVIENYKEWLSDFISQFQGSAYFLKGNEKMPYTLNYLVDATSNRVVGQEKNMTFGVNQAKSFGTKRLNSIAEIKKNSNNLISKEEMNLIDKKNSDNFFSLSQSLKYISSNDWGKLDSLSRAIADYYKGTSIVSALRKNDFSSPTSYQIDLFKYFADELKNSPVDYFEAKYQRAVSLSEFKYAVIPFNTDTKTIDILRSNKLIVKKYKTDEDRFQIVNNISEKDKSIKFDNGGNVNEFIIGKTYSGKQVRDIVSKYESQEGTDMQGFAISYIKLKDNYILDYVDIQKLIENDIDLKSFISDEYNPNENIEYDNIRQPILLGTNEYSKKQNTVLDGYHRVLQALYNKDKKIVAFVNL